MSLEQKSLKGKVAIVTGGGSGLGKAIALVLAEAGADIVVAGRRLEHLKMTAREVQELGARALAISTDVTDSQQVNHMVERTVSELGKIDILVNDAGGGEGHFPIQELSDDMWHVVVAKNLDGCFFCCRAVAKYFLAQKSGKAINISAGGGLRGARDNYAYCSAKAGVISFSYCLALSWARDNIQVNIIAPGFFDTHGMPADEKKQRSQFIAAGRVGEPREIGLLALFLASDASNYINGQVFTMDGGALASGYAPTGFVPTITVKEN